MLLCFGCEHEQWLRRALALAVVVVEPLVRLESVAAEAVAGRLDAHAHDQNVTKTN